MGNEQSSITTQNSNQTSTPTPEEGKEIVEPLSTIIKKGEFDETLSTPTLTLMEEIAKVFTSMEGFS